MGDAAGAERVASQVLARAVEPDLFVDLHWTLAQSRMRTGSLAESAATMERALAGPEISARHRSRLLVLTARAHCYVGEIEKAGQVATAALAVASEAGDDWAIAWALHVLTLVSVEAGRLPDALPLFNQVLTATQADPALTDLRLLLQINKSVTLGCLDQYEEALAFAGQALDLAGQVGTTIRLVQAHSARGQLLFQTGRWDDALAEVSILPADLKELDTACIDLGIAAVIEFHRGDLPAARRHLAAAAPYAERLGRRSIFSYALARSLDREHDGALTEALTALTARFIEKVDAFGEIEDMLPDAVRLATETGDLSIARALAGHAEVLAAGLDIPHRQAHALYCRGLLDHHASGLLAAAERYQDASRPLMRAKALEAAAAELERAGDHDRARAASAGRRISTPGSGPL
jgi:tetratricopeptide (TPR) repeat protein